MKAWILVVVIGGLAGCGWQLRGSSQTVASLTEIQLHANDPYTPLYRATQNVLQQNQIRITQNPSAPRLDLVRESIDSRIISYNSELDPAEEELTLTVQYQINKQPLHLQENATLEKNKNRAAAGESEKKFLIDQMRRQLAIRILQQMELMMNTPAGEPAGRESLSR